MFDTYGADAMRWIPAVVADPARRRLRRSPSTGIRDTVRHVILPLWNAWYFLTLYANAAGTRGHVSAPTRPTCSTATCWPSCARSSTT